MKLNELIETLRQGRSYAQLSRESNNTITTSTLQKLATKPISTYPTPQTIRLLAQLLKTTETNIITAATESLHLATQDDFTQTITYWENHAQHWKNKANRYHQDNEHLRQHFKRLNPISKTRPWLNVGTQAQTEHLQQNDEQPNPLRGSSTKGEQ